MVRRKLQISMEGGAKPKRNPNGGGLLYRTGDLMMAVDIGSCYRVLVLQEAATIRQILKAGTFYLALVFAIGFMVGTLRTHWIVPRVGVRAAELMETPIMFAAIVFAVSWVARRLLVPPTVTTRRPLRDGFCLLDRLHGMVTYVTARFAQICRDWQR
jgi:hypothetical protein